MASSTLLIENKKKKERRKEKDTSTIETSDEEVNSAQGKIFYNLMRSIIAKYSF